MKAKRPWLLLLLFMGPWMPAPFGCNADAEDCAKLGDKFVELYEAELDEDSRKLAPEVLASAAQAGRSEVIEQCRRLTYSKASVARCLDAKTMDEFMKC